MPERSYPEEMISGAIPAPRFNLENLEGLARHVRSVVLETAKLEYPKDVAKYIREEGEIDAVALQEVRNAIAGAYPEARERAWQAFGSITGVARAWTEERVSETADRVEEAILRRAEAIKRASFEMHKLDGVGEQRQWERRRWNDLAVALRVGSSGDQQAYLPRILAEAGVIPGYAFPSDPGSLTLGFDPQPLQASRVQAQREYAPGQIVYARGSRWQVTRLALFRPDLGSSPGVEPLEFIECGSCKHANRADANVCARPSCGATLDGATRRYVDVGAFQATQRDVDPLSEEERRRERIDQRAHPRYDVPRKPYVLGDPSGDGLQLELSHGETILYLNHGRQERGKIAATPYRLCLTCGETFDPPITPKAKGGGKKKTSTQPPPGPIYSEAEVKHRDPSRCGGQVEDYLIGHEVKSDILRLRIPQMLAGSPESGTWAWSVAAAIVAGAIRAYDLDDDDLEPLVAMERDAEGKERPVEVLWIDDVMGGSGILDELVENFDRVAEAALQHLQAHIDGRGCERSCYQCLRTYRTAWRGDVFDWHAAVGFLQNAARLKPATGELIEAVGDEMSSPEWQRARAEGCDSPIELRLLEALRAAGLPEPQKQLHIDHPTTERLMTIADFAYPEQKLLIYVDGLAWHNTRRQRILDARQQRTLSDMGWTVQRYLGCEIWSDAAACARSVARALSSTNP
ncbi:MAG: Zn-binding domain-containing protein [Vulcanimicrobiaceae bacterium]